MDIEQIGKLAQVEFMAEDQQLVQQALQLIKMPEFVLRCQVESDTLSDIDFQAEKQDRMDYMQSISGFLKDALPTIQNDPMMGPFLLQLLQFSLAGFKVGKKFEGEMDRVFQQIQQKLANPPPPQPSPEEQKMQGEMKLMEQEGQQKAQEHQMRMQEGQQKVAMGQQNLQLKAQENKLKLVGHQQDAAIKQQQGQQKMEQNKAAFWQKLQEQQMKHAMQTFQGAIPSVRQ